MGIIIIILACVGTQSGSVGRKYGHHRPPCPHGWLVMGTQEPIQAGTSSPRGTHTPWTILLLKIPDFLSINSQTLPSPCSPSPQGRGWTQGLMWETPSWHSSVGTGRIWQCQGLLQEGSHTARVCS